MSCPEPYKFGSVCTFECDTGYELPDSAIDEAKCIYVSKPGVPSGADWDGIPTECISKCVQPGVPGTSSQQSVPVSVCSQESLPELTGTSSQQSVPVSVCSQESLPELTGMSKQRVVVEGEESSWRPVISGVPQGSVLGPILFLIYINDLENEIGSNILKFADDTKMFRRVESQEDRHQLQSDLNKLVKWAEKWQMLFNKDKCKCLHIGQANAKNNYLMNNTVLLSTEREKDVGVVVSSDMKVSEQCGIAARKGNQILGLIRRNIAYRDKRLIIPLYMSLVRPHLEYCIQAWRPHMRKDIDKLERVQRRATRLISEISQLSYEERLQQCRLTTLETRRIRGDQIEVFKIMHGYEGLNKDMFFRIKNDSITRGHSLALVKSHSRLDIRKYTFSQRVVNDWNKLPEECINATSVNMFKNKIDQYYLKTRRE